jgi:S1-C subfamily serine protease
VVAAELAESEPGSADFFVATRAEELPPAGLLGIFLRRDDQGLVVDALSEDSGAREAGLVAGDRLVRVDGREVPHLAALKLALMTHEPGERVPVEYARADPDGLVTRHEVKVTLR